MNNEARRVSAAPHAPPLPDDWIGRLSSAAQALIRQACADLGTAPVCDYHAHVVGNSPHSGAMVHAGMLSWRHPLRRLRAGFFAGASGIRGFTGMDAVYVERLVRLARAFGHPLKIHILAMDHAYRPDGTIDHDKTEFFVPNAYIVRLAETYPDLFVPVISVHPYRSDALRELEKWAQRGVRMVKWLPNAQGIDPSAPRNDAFYKMLQARAITLLTHTGKEMSVTADTMQAMGNPLLLRRPLEQGVKVIMAHCASSGRNADLDHPGQQTANVELFFRMMDDTRYRGLLFADISATTQVNRTPRPMLDLLARPALQSRLVYGSDYPLPAINCVIWTLKLVFLGMLAPAERRPLNEIYAHNPLLFDFVLKRTLRHPITGQHLQASVFLEQPALRRAP